MNFGLTTDQILESNTKRIKSLKILLVEYEYNGNFRLASEVRDEILDLEAVNKRLGLRS